MYIQDELYIQKEGENTDVKIYRRILLWQYRSSSKKHQIKQSGAETNGSLDAERGLPNREPIG